ncbi:MAG TPA: DUF429 domain-containing protein [Chloroflexia bacterium]|nr:DUF429 domain-containing protein [Chloroflexia bacterium]
MSTPLFIGLDLAWSARNNTAGALLIWSEENARAELADSRANLGSNDVIISWLHNVTGDTQPALLAIDAPLVVPNESGARSGDLELSRLFRAYQAGTHPANRTLLGRYGQPPGDIRGETLAACLRQELNFEQNPYLEARASVRCCFECYPHSAMVVLFGLTTTLKYKRKLRGQDNDRFAAFAAFQQHLSDLSRAEPPLYIPPEILGRETRQLRGESLKSYEDLLDAIVCAYVAFYYWWWGQARVHVFGSLRDGYIVTPVTPQQKALLV